jgi:hypothetical protein
MKLLLFMPSPRDIPQVKQHWVSLPHDKLIEKYKTQIDAYSDAKKFFLKHVEYTHLCVCPDDLEITPVVLKVLVDDVTRYDYPVVSGYCPLQENQPDIYNLQMEIYLDETAPRKPKGHWIEKEQMEEMPRFFEVKHAGFGCTIIRRDAFEKCRFTSTQFPDGATHGGNFDYAFCQDMFRNKIPIIVDKSCWFQHWRLLQYHNIINECGYEVFIPYIKRP